MCSKEKSECSDLKDRLDSDHLFVKPKPLNKLKQPKPISNNTTPSSTNNTTTTISTVTNIPRKPSCKRKSKFSSVPPLDAVSGAYGDPQEKRICPDTRLSAPPPKSDNTGFDAAKARAEAINAKLKACGKLSTETSIKPKPVVTQGPSLLSLLQISQITKVNEQMFAAKIDINDLPLALRTNLTQLSVQESLRNVAKSSVLVKGQHLTSVEKKGLDGIEKQLHLFIQALTKERVAKTIASVKELILSSNSPKPTVNGSGIKPVMPMMNGNMLSLPALPTGSYVQEKVFVGMDNAPPEFDLKRKLLGDNYEHFNYIANRNGSKVILRGRGSGFLEPTSGREAFESMYIFISHPQQVGVNASKKLVMDLIENVRSSLSAYMSQFSTPSVGYYPAYGGSYNTPMTSPANYHHPPPQLTIPDQTNFNTKCPGPVPPPPPMPVAAYPPPSTSGRVELVDNNTLHNSIVPPPPSTTLTSTHHTGSKTEEVSTKSSKQRRRFQEAVPDYTSILGYKPLEHSSDYNAPKKSKRSFCEGETINKEKEEVKLENNNKSGNQSRNEHNGGSGLPFWMSMN